MHAFSLLIAIVLPLLAATAPAPAVKTTAPERYNLVAEDGDCTKLRCPPDDLLWCKSPPASLPGVETCKCC
ncbi:hypothetical protein BDV95DRAFT_575355 [Massariosphaeria phaeospora]|uniref:Uncharacterized protein n=1 Tax=Massariosphaeria phaeospora TaxID=100035 RepID=A0A7C8ID77_9PLEO|nr:hypothetical protein BDV95DRAFT_575355 [Massariosphaeria phaeospora]